MFMKENNTYNDIREKSLMQWLDEMEQHEDIAVRGGVKLCREYMQYLKERNGKLEEEMELKNFYLRKMAGRDGNGASGCSGKCGSTLSGNV